MHVIPHRRRGFTLVEIMIVVVIIGLLVAMALPSFRRVRINSQNTRFISDIRAFRGAAESFAMAMGEWPEDSNTGNLPPGLDEWIKLSDFGEETPIGGRYDIEFDDSGITFGIGVVGYRVNESQLEDLDTVHDNGDLTSGKWRKIAADRYYFVLED